MFQEITLIGYLGGDPEMRYTSGGIPVASANLGVSKSHQDANGNWLSETSWFRLTFWREAAERATAQLQKGDLVFVKGSDVKSHAYINKQQEAVATTEVTVQLFRRLSKRLQAGESNGQVDEAVEEEEDVMAIPM
jgi:single-strand DNA-binding protein